MIKTLAICYGLTEADIKPLKNGWFKMPWGRIRVVDGTVVIVQHIAGAYIHYHPHHRGRQRHWQIPHQNVRSPRGVDRFEFVADETVGNRARTRTTVALDVHPEHSELAHFADELGAKPLYLEVFVNLRLNALERELSSLIAPREFFCREERVEPHH
jgi:hypothetical protein